MQSSSRSSGERTRMPLVEIDLNEGRRTAASDQVAFVTPSSKIAIPLSSLATSNLQAHHVAKSESISSNTSTSSVYTMPESPALWFSPVVTPESSPAHSRAPSRKGKERALDEAYDSAHSVKHGLAIDMNIPRLSAAPQDLESGSRQTFMDSPIFSHSRTLTLTTARQETSYSLFKRRSRFVHPVQTPPLLSSTFEVPDLPSVTSQYSSSSSSTRSSTTTATPMTSRTPSWNPLKNRNQTFDHLDRLRIASSPNRRRTDHNTISFNSPSRSMRPVVMLSTVILLAILFFLLGSFSTSSSPPDNMLHPRHSLESQFASVQSHNSFSSNIWNFPLFKIFSSSPVDRDDGLRDREEPQRDTLVLYRILGNDLPPRHVPGQTLRNLRFMLEQESYFVSLQSLADSDLIGIRQVEKYYVLNRISSEELLQSMRDLLAEFAIPQHRILTIPFEWDEYARRQIRWDHGVAEVSGVWGIGRAGERLMELRTHENKTLAAVARAEDLSKAEGKAQNLQGIGRLRAIDFTYHDKNLYAINNNGGRNFALEHGRSLPHSRWVLPLDGNCFFTPSALLTLVQNLEDHGEGEGHKSHVIIPMARLLDNNALLPNNTDHHFSSEADQQKSLLDHLVHLSPHAPEEPQIGFRYDSSESFQLNMRYGRRSKLELLWRLGAVSRSKNLHSRTLPWEQSDREHLTSEAFASIRSQVKDVNQVGFIKAGWVYRLFSGDPNQETFTPEANALRNMNRIRGIVGFLERLDEKLARGRLCHNSTSCGFNQALTWTWDRSALDTMKSRYRVGASEAVKHVKGLVHSAKEIERSLNQQSRPLPEDIATLALASFFTGTRPYAEIAAQLVHDLILNAPASSSLSTSPTLLGDGNGYTFPFLSLGHSRSPQWMDPAIKAQPIAEASSFPLLLDSLRLIESTVPGALSKKQIDTILSQHLVHLLSNKEQLAASALPMAATAANQYDTEVAVLAAYLDDVRLLQRVRDRAVLRTENMVLEAGLVKGFRNLRMFREDDVVSDRELV